MWVVRLEALFPQLLRKQRTAGSFLAQTQPRQILLSPVKLMEGTGNLIFACDGGSHCRGFRMPLGGIAVPPSPGVPQEGLQQGGWIPAGISLGCRLCDVSLVSLPGEEGISSLSDWRRNPAPSGAG